jgi:hypothetical protein
MYNVADTGGQRQPENTDDEYSETGETQTRRRIFFKARTLPGAGHLPKLFELVERI